MDGSGLVLSIARHLVLLNGGVLEVESLVGLGSTFYLRLPVTTRRSLVFRGDQGKYTLIENEMMNSKMFFIFGINFSGNLCVIQVSTTLWIRMCCPILTPSSQKKTKAQFLLSIYLRLLTLFYGYGAIVHLFNLSGWGSLSHEAIPGYWLVADSVYLILNVTMVFGIWLRKRWGVVAFLVAACSQIILYTWFPGAFSMNEQQEDALFGILVFHLATVLLYIGLWLARARR